MTQANTDNPIGDAQSAAQIQAGHPTDVGGKVDTTPTETEFNRDALAATLQEKMDAMNGVPAAQTNDETDLGTVDEATDNQQDADDTVVDDSPEEGEFTDDDDFEDEVVSEVGETDSGEESSSTELTIPEAHIRSLKAYGYDEDRIQANSEKFGMDFLTFAADIHAKRNAEIARWAEAGQRQREQLQEGDPQLSLQAPGVATTPQVPDPLQAIDVTKLRDKYGDEDDFLTEIVGPINAAISGINAVIPGLQQTLQTAQQTEQNAANARIGEFFETETIQPYRKLYGGADKPMTQEQIAARGRLMDMADLILGGAQSQFQNVSLEDALLAAHDVVSADFRETAVRRTIRKEAKTRNRGLSQKPSARQAAPIKTTGDEQTDREARIAAKMREVFKNV
ncbi:MAG: hypothetical protein ACYTKD_32005 [Planctomycetota bacterium]|jgi:hypothetical protein